MTENTFLAAESRGNNSNNVARPWFRRESGLVTVFLGLAVMLLALLLPQDARIFAFYPGIACVIVGTFLTLRHGPDVHREFR